MAMTHTCAVGKFIHRCVLSLSCASVLKHMYSFIFDTVNLVNGYTLWYFIELENMCVPFLVHFNIRFKYDFFDTFTEINSWSRSSESSTGVFYLFVHFIVKSMLA